jgi:pyruvate-formate lyase
MDLTPRLKKIKKRLFNVEFHSAKPWHFIGESILTNEEIVAEPLVVRKAKMYEYIAKNLPAIIKEDELIVGNPNYGSVGFGTVLPRYATDDELEKAKKHLLDETSVWGHHPPDWETVIKKGITGIKAQIEKMLEEEYLKPSIDHQVIDEYRAMLISLDAVIIFARRHAALALKESQRCTNPVRQKELLNIYKVCMKVPEHPAETYHEALQSFWTFYCVLHSGGNYIPLGRADQFLYPYYENDLQQHRITKEQAIDLTGSFLVKFNERVLFDTKQVENHVTFGMFSHGVPYEVSEDNGTKIGAVNTGSFDARTLNWNPEEDIRSESNYSYGQSGNDWLMNLIVAGLNKDGSDATNDLSYLIIDLVHSMELLMPTVSARIHKNSPKSFIKKLAEVLRYGQGDPAIYNDDAVIPGLVDLGFSIEEARGYSNDGCWEVLIPGRTYFTYAHIQNLQCLEWVLTNGVSMLSGKKEGIQTGDPTKFETWDDFYNAYVKQMHAMFDFHVQRRFDNLGLSSMIAPDPLMSTIMRDCIEKGKDVTQGGARYHIHLNLVTGLSNTVNSLAAIKKLVYDEHSLSMEELINALRNNFEGYEKLRARLINDVPKFGNDHEYVDDIAVQLLKDFEDRMMYWREKQNVLMLDCGIGTFENYAMLGRSIGASADGRPAQEALAPNYSPSPGSDVEGPFAVFKSITKPELLRYFGGCPVDISINANEFKGETGLERLQGLIKTFCSLGGQILTITSMNVEELKDAKINPEKHRNLRVRMGGLSAYFIAMAPYQQDVIISRFERGT